MATDLSALRRRVLGAPEDPDAWVSLGRHAARAGLPGDAVPGELLRAFVAAWIRRPREPGMLAVFQHLTGLEPIPPGGAPGATRRVTGRYWRDKRVRPLEDGLVVEKRTGVPLAVRHPGTGMELRWVPRPPDAHREMVGAFVGRYPVTVAEFEAFLRDHPGESPTDYLARNPWELQRRRGDRPVVFMSLVRAREFAAWMGACIPDARLWRHAAAAGRRFPWGKGSPEARATWNAGVPWRGGDWDRFLAPVHAHPEGTGPFGLEDMVGNVWEWTEERQRVSDEELVGGRERQVYRHRLLGGGWGSSRLEELEADGDGRWLDPAWWSDDVGFRVAFELWQPEGSVPERAARAEAPSPRRSRKARRRRKLRRKKRGRR